MSGDDVERKAKTDARGSPAKAAADAERSAGQATTELLTWTPSARGVVRFLLTLLLFGGVVLSVVGGVLWSYSVLGVYGGLTVGGIGCVVVAVLLAQVAVRAGWL